MNGKLQNKFVLITGGGTGIGRSIALLFARQGANVAVCGRKLAPLESVSGELNSLGRRVLTIQADIGSDSDVKSLMQQIDQTWGGLDILVNNASVIGQVGPVSQTDLQQWNDCLRINLTGTMLCCRESIPLMIRRGGGNIVNVSSNVARRGFPNRAPYVCSKWAMLGLTQTLALELAEYNIRVNAICPGPVLTDRLDNSMRQMADTHGTTQQHIHQQWMAQSPMKRFATEEECAKVSLFLACDDSSAMTGQALNVTAGMMMT